MPHSTEYQGPSDTRGVRVVTGYSFSANWNGEICSKCISIAETQSQARGVASEDGTQEGYFANRSLDSIHLSAHRII